MAVIVNESQVDNKSNPYTYIVQTFSYKYLLSPLIYTIGILLIAYQLMGRILFQLNDVQLDRSGDGFKNYFAIAWQYKYGEGLWFEGMQYPYGDMIAYADGQPALMWLMLILKKIGIDFSGSELLVVQILPLLSLYFAAFFLHKIIRSYSIPHWWTWVTVLTCISLSPQIYRCNAHFALAYMFCLPSIWWLYILYDRQQVGSATFMAASTLLLYVYAYLHPYHLLIGSAFLMGLFVVGLFYKKMKWPLLVAATFPIILYLVSNELIDPYSDRPKNPWGTWQYKTEIADLFPFYGWYAKLAQSFTSIRTIYHEGYSYLGILMFAFPILFIYNKRNKIENKSISTFPTKEIIAVFLILLFSMGIHIMITDHKILDWISTLKQFRALGRFAWPYYYVCFIALSVYAYRVLSKLESGYIRIGLFTLIALMWSVDGYHYLKRFNQNMNQYKAPNQLYENKILNNLLSENNVDPKDFQAILPIPVSMEGAEKVTPGDQWFVKIQTIPLAYQTGLPIIGAYMSRTSLSRILKQYQLCSSDYVYKEIIEDMPSDKDLLMVIAHEDTVMYSDLIAKANYIAETKETSVYSITTDTLRQRSYVNVDSIPSKTDALFYNNYDDEKNTGLFSEGSKVINGYHSLCHIDLSEKINNRLTMSLWYRIDADHSSVPKFNINLLDQKNHVEKAINYRDLDMRRMEVVDNWVRIIYELEVSDSTHYIEWSVNAEKLYVDHALVTYTDSLYWNTLEDGHILYDHYIAETN